MERLYRMLLVVRNLSWVVVLSVALVLSGFQKVYSQESVQDSVLVESADSVLRKDSSALAVDLLEENVDLGIEGVDYLREEALLHDFLTVDDGVVLPYLHSARMDSFDSLFSLARRIKAEQKLPMSAEARYLRYGVFEPDTLALVGKTLEDTVFVNPIFLTPILKSGFFGEIELYDSLAYRQPRLAGPLSVQKDTSLFMDRAAKREVQEKVYRHLLYNHYDDIEYTLADLPKDVIKVNTIREEVSDTVLRIKKDGDVNKYGTPTKYVPKRRWWTSSMVTQLDFTQTYVSPNWHKGGTSNLNLFTMSKFIFVYNKENVRIDNDSEWRLNFFNAPDDTVRSYRIAQDQLRVYTKFGYKAFKNWYYSFSTEFKTQVLTSYQQNSNKVNSGLFAPLYMNLGLGMDYNLNKALKKGRNINASINISALAYNYMYSRRLEELDLGKFGFEKIPDTEDRKNTWDKVGSSLTARMTFKMASNITWTSRFYYFTSYEQVISEFENTFDFAINRFLSARIFLHARFDDGVTRKEDFDTYFQFTESMKIGFNYRW